MNAVPRAATERLLGELTEHDAVAVEVLDLELAKALLHRARRLRHRCAAREELGMKRVDVVDVHVCVAFEGRPRPGWNVSATNLQVDPRFEAFGDRVHPAWLVGRRLEDAVIPVPVSVTRKIRCDPAPRPSQENAAVHADAIAQLKAMQ